MDFNYTKIRLGNWLYKNCFPLYNFSYKRFKLKNDKREIEVLRTLIQPGSFVLDIGANIGFYASILSQITGNKGRVYCFEPDKKNFEYLKKNVKDLRNVTCFNTAVSDKKQVLKIYRSKLLNVDHRTYPVNNYDTVEEINAVSIDDLIAEKIIPKVDLIKIDIQGYELSAFRGMTNLLSKNNGLNIIAEYWPHGFKRAGTSAVEFFDFFNEMGYQFLLIDEAVLKPIDRKFIVENNDREFEYSFNVLIKK